MLESEKFLLLLLPLDTIDEHRGHLLLICYVCESISNCERSRSQFANQEKKDRIDFMSLTILFSALFEIIMFFSIFYSLLYLFSKKAQARR